MNLLKHILYLIILLLFSETAQAQSGRVSQSDVELQQLFIEANREKLLGNHEKAVELFGQVLSRDKDNHASAYELARVYNEMDENKKAIKYAKMAVEKDETNIWYRIFLADMYQKVSEDGKAAEVYEGLVEIQPNNDYYYLKWAYYLVRTNQTDKALKVYDALEKRIGINEELTRRKHTLYLGTGNYKKAAKELENLIEAFPKKLAYRHLLASFYEQIGEPGRAKEVFKEILKLNPEDARANLALAGDGKSGSETRYLRSLKPVFENPNVNIDVKISELFPYINKVADTGEKTLADAALELTDILEKVHPNQAKSYSAAADLFYYSDRKKEAVEKYKTTLQLDENIYLVWEQLLYAYAELKDHEALVETSEEALGLFPNQATLFYLNGLGLSGLEKHKDAVSSLNQALIMSGRLTHLKFDIHVLLGKEYFLLKQYDRSDKSFEAALTLNPNDPDLLDAYAYCLSERGAQLDKAKELAALANELAPNVAAYQHTYGWVLYKMKAFKASKNWMAKALQIDGEKDPALLEHYGDALFHLGNEDEAVHYWQLALDKGGKSASLEKKIADRKLEE